MLCQLHISKDGKYLKILPQKSQFMDAKVANI